MRPSITKDPRATQGISPGCQTGVPTKLRFAFGIITERNLGLCAQLPMPSGRQLGILRWRHAINHPPAWLTTIFIWDRCRAPSSAMGSDRAHVATLNPVTLRQGVSRTLAYLPPRDKVLAGVNRGSGHPRLFGGTAQALPPAAHEAARFGAGVLAPLEDRGAGDQGGFVAFDPLHQAPAAGGE